MQPRRLSITATSLVGIALLYALIAITGIRWGLPTSAEDAFLFPRTQPWSGGRIAALSGAGARTEPTVAADVDVTPVRVSGGPVLLNDTEAGQAEIYRRFRLFTHQPDEMITMMALSGMDPRSGNLDPKLYQYGGLFIYPVGALLAIGDVIGVVAVRGDMAYYLDNPEAFADFYVLGRLYAAAWGLLGILAVYGIGRQVAGPLAGVLAALLFALLPVVACMAHEAKPHLPGAVLMLTAVWMGLRALDRQTWKAWAGLFICTGAAIGMVLSSWPILFLIPVVIGMHCRNQTLRQRHEMHECSRHRVDYRPVFVRATLGGWLVALVVYLLTNPYVVINLFANRAVLASNFGNSLAMYEISRLHHGIVRVAELTIEGATWPVVIGGLVALFLVVRRRELAALPLIVPAAIFALQFALIGADKPDEYGRFGVFHEAALAIGCAAVLAGLARRSKPAMIVLVAVACAWCAIGTGGYLWSFHADGTGQGSRTLAAEYLLGLEPDSVAVIAEPAPYSCPPLDFAATRVLLYRDHPEQKVLDRIRAWSESHDRESPLGADAPRVLVAAVDNPAAILSALGRAEDPETRVFESRSRFLPRSRISWANKPIVVLSRTAGTGVRE